MSVCVCEGDVALYLYVRMYIQNCAYMYIYICIVYTYTQIIDLGGQIPEEGELQKYVGGLPCLQSPCLGGPIDRRWNVRCGEQEFTLQKCSLLLISTVHPISKPLERPPSRRPAGTLAHRPTVICERRLSHVGPNLTIWRLRPTPGQRCARCKRVGKAQKVQGYKQTHG